MQHLFENQRWMPYFHDNKTLFQCEQINKTKKKLNWNLFPCWNLKHQLNLSCHMWILFIWCFTFQGRVGGNSTLFERAALPTLLSLRSPTQTLGYLHGYSGSKSPENITQLKQSNVCYLCGDAKTRVAYQGQNIRPADFAPTLLRTRPRKKGREPRIIFVVHVIISFVGLKFFTCVQVTAVLSGNVWFTFPFASAFSYPAYE